MTYCPSTMTPPPTSTSVVLVSCCPPCPPPLPPLPPPLSPPLPPFASSSEPEGAAGSFSLPHAASRLAATAPPPALRSRVRRRRSEWSGSAMVLPLDDGARRDGR